MRTIKLINKLEEVSLKIPDRVLRLKGFVTYKNKKELLEILIYRGFSSSTTHPIEIDQQKNVLNERYLLRKCELLKAPLSSISNKVIKETDEIEKFLDISFWK